MLILGAIISYFISIIGDSILDRGNHITVVNNSYYVCEEQSILDPEYYNELGLCFVSEEFIFPRESIGNNSRIVSSLKCGMIVKRIEKKKKWVKIKWSEGGTYKEGWIQNYKLGIFR